MTKQTTTTKKAESKKFVKADIKIIGYLNGKKVKTIAAKNIADMWRKIQIIWAISRDAKVTVKKNGEDFMKLWSEKKANGSWWQRNKIVETRRSMGGKKYLAAKAEAEQAIAPTLTEEPAAEVPATAEA